MAKYKTATDNLVTNADNAELLFKSLSDINKAKVLELMELLKNKSENEQ